MKKAKETQEFALSAQSALFQDFMILHVILHYIVYCCCSLYLGDVDIAGWAM